VEAGLVVVGLDLLDLDPLRPRIDEPLLGSLEVVLDVALAADEGAHLLPGGHRVRVVVRDPLRGLERPDPLEEGGAGDAQLHRLRVVTVDAGDRMLEVLPGLAVRHLVEPLEAGEDVAVAEPLVDDVERGVAVRAGAGLVDDLLPLGERLVLEHVGVPALLAEIDREGVAVPHRHEAWILLEPRLRHHRARVGVGRGARHRLAAAEAGPHLVHGTDVMVVLEGEVLPPDRRIVGVVVELDDAEERVAGLRLPLGDVHQQRDDRGPDEGGDDRHRQQAEGGGSGFGAGSEGTHGALSISAGVRRYGGSRCSRADRCGRRAGRRWRPRSRHDSSGRPPA